MSIEYCLQPYKTANPGTLTENLKILLLSSHCPRHLNTDSGACRAQKCSYRIIIGVGKTKFQNSFFRTRRRYLSVARFHKNELWNALQNTTSPARISSVIRHLLFLQKEIGSGAFHAPKVIQELNFCALQASETRKWQPQKHFQAHLRSSISSDSGTRCFQAHLGSVYTDHAPSGFWVGVWAHKIYRSATNS